MPTKLVMRRKGHTLYAAAPWEADMLERFPEGVDLNIAVTRARSLRQNNTYWGLLAWVIANGPEWIGKKWPEPEHLSDALQIDLGYVRYVALFNGEVRAYPESKSFEEMPQDRFNRYFEAVQQRLNQMCNYDPLELYLNRSNSSAALHPRVPTVDDEGAEPSPPQAPALTPSKSEEMA